MTKIKKETLQEIGSIQTEMSALTQDKIKEIAPAPVEIELKMSLKERAKLEGVLYIEPKRKMKPFGKLKPEWQQMHDNDWEYVKGVFQNESMNGRNSSEPIQFWFLKWAGDPDCLWEVPVNVPVYLPRMIAIHLSGERQSTGIEAMKYHTFDYVQSPASAWQPDQFTHHFTPTGTHYRGKFVPIGAFS